MGLPIIPSIKNITKCPPSNTGKGNKLINPIVIESKIIKFIKDMKPSCNIIPEK